MAPSLDANGGMDGGVDVLDEPPAPTEALRELMLSSAVIRHDRGIGTEPMKVPVDPRESAADERSIDEGLADADAGNLHEGADVSEVTLPTAAVEKIAALAQTPARAGARLRAAAKRR